MILSLSVSFIIGCLSILLLMGKCSWLIAGYNTASKNEKAKYDEKKLCRTFGITLLFVSISTAAMSFYQNNIFIMICVIFQVLVCTIGVIYGNVKCKKK